MHNTLAHLCERTKASRAGWTATDAIITVARADHSLRRPRFRGVVLIDGRPVGRLGSGSAREFVVSPGEHELSVCFIRRLHPFSWPGTPDRDVCTASVTLAAGGRANFVCGTRPDVVRRWRRAVCRVEVRAHVISAGICAVGGVGWLLAPLLRQAVAITVFYLPGPDVLIPLAYRLATPPMAAIAFALLAACAAHRLDLIPRACSDRDMRQRIGTPYYLRLTDQQPSVSLNPSAMANDWSS